MIVAGWAAANLDGSDARSSDALGIAIGWALVSWAAFNIALSWRQRTFDMFSPFTFMAVLMALAYGVGLIHGPYSQGGDYSSVFRDVRHLYPTVGMCSAVGYLAFIVGYRSDFAKSLGRGWRWPHWQASYQGSIVFFFILQVGGWLSRYVNFRHGIYLQTGGGQEVGALYVSLVGLFAPFTYPATVLALVQYNHRKYSANPKGLHFWGLAALISITAELIYGLPSGSKTLLFMPIVLWLFARNYSAGRVPLFKACLIGITLSLAFVFIFPLTNIYRDLTSAEIDQSSFSLSTISQLLSRAVDDYLALDPAERRRTGEEQAVRRLSYAGVLARIIEWNRQSGQMLGGSTYGLAVVAIIPRILWPGKPTITLGHEFQWMFGFGQRGQRTSLAVTMLGEMFANFGFIGIVFGMTIFGLFYRQVYRIFCTGIGVLGGIAIPAYMLFWYNVILDGTASNFAAVFSGMLRTFILFFLIARMCGYKKRDDGSRVDSR